jgi:pyruvate dehydrogenase (quinone)
MGLERWGLGARHNAVAVVTSRSTVLDRLQAGGGPAVPPRITFQQSKGFTLWATRSILSGDGSAVLEVAEANLRQLALE